jgi:hypothetical protein
MKILNGGWTTCRSSWPGGGIAGLQERSDVGTGGTTTNRIIQRINLHIHMLSWTFQTTMTQKTRRAQSFTDSPCT